MNVKENKQTGWWRGWYSKLRRDRRRGRRPHTCKLRCEMLERRELLSASVVPGATTFKTIPVACPFGNFSALSGGASYTANAEFTGSIAYSSTTQGTLNGTVSGTVTSPQNDAGQTFDDVVSPLALTGENLSGGGVTGTFDTSQFISDNTSGSWTSSYSTGTWSGLLKLTITTPFSVSLTTPTWDSAAHTQVDFGFTVGGSWDPVSVASYNTAVDTVDAYWANGTTFASVTTRIGSVPIYWNQASGAASIQGISTSSPPSPYILLVDHNSTATIAAFPLVIADGNFETPSLAAGMWQFSPSGTPWQFTGSAGISSNQSAFTAGNPNAPDGTQVGLVKDGGSINQTVQLAAGSYQISFQAAQRGNSQSQPQQIEVLVNSSVVGTITPSSTAYATYATLSFSVTAVRTRSSFSASPRRRPTAPLLSTPWPFFLPPLRRWARSPTAALRRRHWRRARGSSRQPARPGSLREAPASAATKAPSPPAIRTPRTALKWV